MNSRVSYTKLDLGRFAVARLFINSECCDENTVMIFT